MSIDTFDPTGSTIDYSVGTEQGWENFKLPVPANIVVLTTDTKQFKYGDGVRRYPDLPNGPTIAGIVAGTHEVVTVLKELGPENDVLLVVNSQMYDASTVHTYDLTTRLTNLTSTDITQDGLLDTITSTTDVGAPLVGDDNNKLAMISGGKLAPGVFPSTLANPVQVPPLCIMACAIYSDANHTAQVSSLTKNATYYAKITASHDIVDTDLIELTLSVQNEYVSLFSLGRGLFRIKVANAPNSDILAFTATATVDSDTVDVTLSVQLDVVNIMLFSIFGATYDEAFFGLVVDHSGNIICVGYTSSDPYESGESSCLVVKFDTNLNILTKKVYAGYSYSLFTNVTVDPYNNIICVGYTTDTPSHSPDALVVRFDTNLNLIAAKIQTSDNSPGRFEYFYDVVTDASGNIFCIGVTSSDFTSGAGTLLIVKFTYTLAVTLKKYFYTTALNQGGISNAVVIDQAGNLVIVGYETFPTILNQYGGGRHCARISVFTQNLVLIKYRWFSDTANSYVTVFNDIIIDPDGNYLCVGRSDERNGSDYSSYPINCDGLIIRFDTNLEILAMKMYGGSVSTIFNSVSFDSDGNIYCAGLYGPATYGAKNDAIVVKLAPDLSFIKAKMYYGAGDEMFNEVIISSDDNVLCFGYTTSAGYGLNDCLMMKIPNSIPNGSFISTIIPGLTLTDQSLTQYDPTGVLFDVTLSSGNSITYPISPSANYTLKTSILTQLKDTLTI